MSLFISAHLEMTTSRCKAHFSGLVTRGRAGREGVPWAGPPMSPAFPAMDSPLPKWILFLLAFIWKKICLHKNLPDQVHVHEQTVCSWALRKPNCLPDTNETAPSILSVQWTCFSFTAENPHTNEGRVTSHTSTSQWPQA